MRTRFIILIYSLVLAVGGFQAGKMYQAQRCSDLVDIHLLRLLVIERTVDTYRAQIQELRRLCVRETYIRQATR